MIIFNVNPKKDIMNEMNEWILEWINFYAKNDK